MNTLTVLKKLSVAAAGAAFIALGTTGSASAATFTFNTSDSQFDPGIGNQGWWSGTRVNYNDNDNYFVGNSGGNFLRNFFTFDLSSLSLTETVVSATLQLQRYFGFGDATETLGLFDVSTDAATLNNNNGTSAAIFNDLGTGTSYGTFEVSTSGNPDDILSFTLNSAAIADINAATGSFFSIGGSLLSSSGSGSPYLFASSSGNGVQRLMVETATNSEPVPEPLTILGSGLALGFGSLMKRQQSRKLKKMGVAE